MPVLRENRMPSRVFVFCLLLSAAAAQAQSRWNLTTADFQVQPITLQAIDGKTVRFVDKNNAEQSLPLDQFIVAEGVTQTVRNPAGKFRLVLVGGASVTGDLVTVKEENLVFASALLGEMTVPLKQASRLESIVRIASVKKIESSATEDVVVLSNGDAVRGFVQQVTPAAVVVKTADGPSDVPSDSIALVTFATTDKPADRTEAGFRIRVDDGSWLNVDSLSVAGNTVTVGFAGVADRKLDLGKLLAIEQTNGPVSWLSSRTPSENVQTPYLDAVWPARMDRSVTGDPIRVGSKTYAHGIGVHSQSKITWPLDGSYKTFRTQYSMDGKLPRADVDVRILLDGKVVHEAKNFRAGTLAPVFQVDLGSAKSITLEVGFGGGYDVQDRFLWIEPALLRN
jgi:hypothetical protein